MTPEAGLALWAAAFAGSHLLMSHPLRAPLVRGLGERGFLLAYSLVSLVTFGMAVRAYGAAQSAAVPLWSVPTGLWILACLLMWLASIWLVGSLRRNPALPHPEARALASAPVAGVYATTRHPMMWSFALWGLSHVLVNPTAPSLILSTAIIWTALVGAAGQDVKKARLMGAAWKDWRSRTSFVPFARGLHPVGSVALVGGTFFFLLATYAHGWLGAAPSGPWIWL